MSMLRSIKFLLPLLLACGAAPAADWVPIDAGNRYGEVKATDFIDVSSVRITGGLRRAWFKTIMAPPIKRGVGPNASKNVVFFLQNTSYKCIEEAYRIEASNFYFEDGTTEPDPQHVSGQWISVPPDSVAESALKFVCAWKSK